MKTLIIGTGNIGSTLCSMLTEQGIEAEFLRTRDDIRSLRNILPFFDAVFLAISTKDRGEAAFAYIQACVEGGKPIVTCEKKAVAYRFEALKPSLTSIGYSATVGGASGMLNCVRKTRKEGSIDSAIAILNGTLNYLCSETGKGRPLDAVLEDAIEKRLTEPGSLSLGEVVWAESEDALLKACILFNSLQDDIVAHPLQFSTASLSEEELRKVLSGRSKVRFLVDIRKSNERPAELASFSCRQGDWVIQGRFAEYNPGTFNGLSVEEEMNGLILRSSSGPDVVVGPGAGPLPTAMTMFGDAKALLGI